MRNLTLLILFTISLIFTPAYSYSLAGDELRYVDREYSSPGAHQLASWIASQLRPKEVQEVPVIPYRLPLQGKRNSEVSNALLNSEETQKMYRDGRK